MFFALISFSCQRKPGRFGLLKAPLGQSTLALDSKTPNNSGSAPDRSGNQQPRWDLGKMFQFKRDFNEYFCGARHLEDARTLNTALQSFDAWLAQNKVRIPLGQPKVSARSRPTRTWTPRARPLSLVSGGIRSMIGGNALSKVPMDECSDPIIATMVDGASKIALLQESPSISCGITPM
jgi:hypothetical protein